MRQKIGLVCGYGEIAKIALDAAEKSGYEPVVVKLNKLKILLSLVFKLGNAPLRPSDILDFFKSKGATKIAIVGKFPKAIMFAKFAGDELGNKLEAERDKRDSNIYDKIRRELANRGFELVPQSELLSSLLAPAEGFWGPEPTKEVMDDLTRAREVAHAIANIGAGQTAIVKNGAVVALEAFEHTDLAINRAAKLAKGGFVVVKVPWPGEKDLDIPAVGEKTVSLIAKKGGRALGVVGKSAIIVTPEVVKRLCENLGVTLYFFADA